MRTLRLINLGIGGLLFTSLLLLGSCSDSGLPDDDDTPSPSLGEIIPLEFVSHSPSIAHATGNSTELTWSSTDVISIFDSKGVNNKFTTDISTPSVTADFMGNVSKSSSYLALYPYNENYVLEDGCVKINIPTSQTLTMPTTISDLDYVYSYLDGNSKDVYFNRLLTTVSFSLSGSNVSEIRRIVFHDKGGLSLCGEYKFNISDFSLTPSSSLLSDVNLSGDFETDVRYYFSVATLPGLFQSGLTVTFYNSSGGCYTTELEKPSSALPENKYFDFGEISLGKLEYNFTMDDLKLPGKKGASVNIVKVMQLKPWWNYTWSNSVPFMQPNNVEFIPMSWGGFKPEVFLPKINQMVASGITDRFLGFNEPDKKDQSNMTVDRALELWPYLESLGIPLGSPAVAEHPCTSPWFDEFMTRAEKLGYRIDFVCVHDYGGGGVEAFKNKLTSIHNKFKKPILVTEFAVADWKAGQHGGNKHPVSKVKAFMEQVLPWMEETEWILGYCWFPFGEQSLAGCTSALFHDDGTLTELGQQYADFKPNNIEKVKGEYYIDFKSDTKIDSPLYFTEYDEVSGSGKIFFTDSAIPEKLFAGNTHIEEITIPSNITVIGKYCFSGCSSLKKVNFEESSVLEEVCDGAFLGCTSIESIAFPSSLKYIRMEALKNLTSLSSVDFGENSNLEVFGYMALAGCTSFNTRILLPSSLVTIGGNAFPPVDGLEIEIHAEYNLDNKTPVLNTQKSFESGKIKNIYVPSSSLDAYKSAPGWSEFSDKILPIE